ncbi:hypothetical protein H9P43_001228 [Blastocladiella emersonii ATCC 22665]|nr:hypothetical protein H9P43_001228 [Blastocladiella emersonii ATCC 22665]
MDPAGQPECYRFTTASRLCGAWGNSFVVDGTVLKGFGVSNSTSVDDLADFDRAIETLTSERFVSAALAKAGSCPASAAAWDAQYAATFWCSQVLGFSYARCSSAKPPLPSGFLPATLPANICKSSCNTYLASVTGAKCAGDGVEWIRNACGAASSNATACIDASKVEAATCGFARPATIGCKCAAADKAKFPCPTATSTIAARPTSAATATAVSANGLGEAGATGMNSGTLAAILGSVGGLVLICAAATAWWWMRRRRSAGKGYSRRRLSNDVADEAAAAGDLYSPVTPGSRSQDSPRTSTSRGRGPATPASPPAPTLHLDPAVSQGLGMGIDIDSTGTVRDVPSRRSSLSSNRSSVSGSGSRRETVGSLLGPSSLMSLALQTGSSLSASADAKSRRTTTPTSSTTPVTLHSLFPSTPRTISGRSVSTLTRSSTARSDLSSLFEDPVPMLVVARFHVQNADELTVYPGDTLLVHKVYSDGWALAVDGKGCEGFVPVACIVETGVLKSMLAEARPLSTAPPAEGNAKLPFGVHNLGPLPSATMLQGGRAGPGSSSAAGSIRSTATSVPTTPAGSVATRTTGSGPGAAGTRTTLHLDEAEVAQALETIQRIEIESNAAGPKRTTR